MTDKSFGDYPNRNIVKNPLLSSAVTGLSLEDLTHNAMLLPVSLSQEVITRPDEQKRHHTTALGNTELAVSTRHAGDANSNQLLQSTSQIAPPNPFAISTNQNTYQNIVKPQSTQSKASLKTDDDFDVNEYFARLHGTRYVSAPLNSNLKEDSNANLEATEENLEEINLNEPEKVDENSQQSLTADIAQNFSQLPTVLPQMASAMFSSFSNMLQTRKSREPTPEVSSGYQEVQFQRSEPSPVAAPPKEPPTLPPSVGTANYRLPPKKKYAQIPGLSSGETAQIPFQNPNQTMPPTSQINPHYFVPSSDNSQNQSQPANSNITSNFPTYFVPNFDNKQENIDNTVISDNRDINLNEETKNVSLQDMQQSSQSVRETNVDVFSSNTASAQPQAQYSQDVNQTATLPPPPTFANIPRRNSQTGVGTSILPPSVARRISSNPYKKPPTQIPQVPSNIFIPAPVENSPEQSSTYPSLYAQVSSEQSSVPLTVPHSASNISQTSTPVLQPRVENQSTVLQFPPGPVDSSFSHQTLSVPLKTEVTGGDTQSTSSMSASIYSPTSFFTNSQEVKHIQSPIVMPSNNTQTTNQGPTPLFKPETSSTAPASTMLYPSSNNQNVPPPSMFMPTTPMSAPNIPTGSATITTPILPNASQKSLPPLPSCFTTAESKEFPPITVQTTVKPMQQPPKATGNVNFRMTKKRPKYYSGPIGGVGDISNNIKPVMPPIDTGAMNLPPMSGAFQGALFTPAGDHNQTQRQNEPAPFDISKPTETTYPTVGDTPQSQVYGTAFDLSRPTTESYSEPKQETAGFGLLGSLKSKLTSLDINKIQSSVTTFFDPAYNEGKKESQPEKPQENYPYEQPHHQPQQYGQTQNNFEIFVPNTEQTNPNYNQSYLYQMQFQNQFQYNQQEQAYLSNEPHNYYQNQGYHGQHHQSLDQNISSYFGTTTQSFQIPIGTASYQVPNPAVLLPTSVSCAHPNSVLPKSSVPEIQQTYFTNPNYQSQDSIQAQISSESGSEIKEPSMSPYTSNISLRDNQGFEGNANFFDSIPQTQLPQKDLSNLRDQNINLGVDISKSFFVNSESETMSENIAELTQSCAQISLEACEPVNEASQEKQIHQPSNEQSTNSFPLFATGIPKTECLVANKTSGKEETTVSNEIKSKFSSDGGMFDKTSNDALKTVHKDLQPKPENVKSCEIISPNIKDVMFKLQNNPADFFGTFNQAKLSKGNSFSQLLIDCKNEVSKEEQKKHEVIIESSGETPLNTPSGPLLGLSSVLANTTKELNVLQDDIQNMVIRDSSDGEALFYRNINPSSYDNVEVETESSDLNICETCRELEQPDDIEELEDLTTQMIENITSPICLENAVVVPLSESNVGVEERDDFDSNQCAEINHITEETIETIQVQSAAELLDDIPSRDYGWSTDEVPVVPTDIDEDSFQLPSFKPSSLDNEFGLTIDPKSIGFFGSNNVYENITSNIGAELQAEFKDQDISPVLLPSPLSVPTAPPEEDKSDGIDVHSIEQDASKDFPLFEEYVIEPAQDSDDDSEEICQSSMNIESFSRRVDKFKKTEDTDEAKLSPVFNLSASPPKPMASYFDTGNYAVETHYRNSLTSPTSLPFGSPNQMRVPPGFEDEFQNRIPFQDKNIFGDDCEPFIPETSTQTRPITTFTTADKKIFGDACDPFIPETSTQPRPITTFSTADKKIFGDDCEPFIPETSTQTRPITTFSTACKTLDTITTYVTTSLLASGQSYVDTTAKIPNFTKLSGEISPDSSFTTFADLTGKCADFSTIKADPISLLHSQEPQTNLPDFSFFGPKKNDLPQEPSLVQDEQNVTLPDPLNFFGGNTESTNEDQGLNRLASYFTSPPKTEHTKSFFELSQSQDHYRHKPEHITSNPDDKTNVSSMKNIPSDQYLANLNIMRDLATFQPDFQPEQSVRTVNYFTIEYDKTHELREFSRGEPDIKNDVREEITNNLEAVFDDNVLINTLQKCKHCCDVTGRVRSFDAVNPECMMVFKVKKCMDSNITNKEEKKDISMSDQSSSSVNAVVTPFGPDSRENNSEGIAVAVENRTTAEYNPVRHHWFYRVDVEGKSIWRGFSTVDSKALEDAFCSPDLSENTVVATDGGRYDVNVKGRLRFAVYWSDKPSNVRRCSWFYKGTTDARYVPYTEDVAETLEEEYRHGITTGEWHRRLVLPNNEMVVMHGPAVMVHFLQANASDAFSSAPLFSFGKRVYRNPPKIRVSRDQPPKIDHLLLMVHGAGEYRHQREKIQSTMRPRVVRRGHDESEIEDVEPSSINHLLLLCHGVGSACDMRFRNVEEVVDDFRTTSLQLIQSHYKNSYDSGAVGRVEVLPISWHATLHSGETGVDKRLARVTLDSIPRLRSFTNDTVLDVLFYTSPVFCQTIINTVCAELNRIYKLFLTRNPNFKGGVSLGGHSLGSVILYDLLCHQQPVSSDSERKHYVVGAAGSGQPSVKYPPLDFSPDAMYALGSPIAIFECIRGVEQLGPSFGLPTCGRFFNIFHPYDPIAYRIEPLINPELQDVKPYLIPHHKGRKRMHLELKDTMARVGADIKQKLIESIKSTWSSMWKSPPADSHLEKVVEEEFEKESLTDEPKEREDTEHTATPEMLGKLNGGRRVDYVLQEAPFEMINEYLFAMSSHVCYWESEDTMLMMLREIYDSMGVQPDSTVPQANLTVQRTKIQQDELTVNLVCKDKPSTSKSVITD